ncbi:kinase-like domain-containing protein, partial [Crepidotus variabilis]
QDRNGFVWLVEKKRPMAIERFSGTLTHASSRTDLQATTIAAFSHFAYFLSKGNRVFADIQGTLTHLDKKDIMVLFDLMTHTPDGSLGVGDFGSDGIKTYIETHIYCDICVALTFKGKKAQDDDSGEEDQSDFEEDQLASED